MSCPRHVLLGLCALLFFTTSFSNICAQEATSGLLTKSGRRLEPIYVPAVSATAGAQALLPALCDELSAALIAVLREANLDARAVPAGSSAGGSAPGHDAENTLVMHLENGQSEHLHLVANWRGAAVSAFGDLEHLDDLVYAVFEQLRARLLVEVAAIAVPSAPPSTSVPPILPAAAPAPNSPPRRRPASAHSAPKAPVKPVADIEKPPLEPPAEPTNPSRPLPAAPVPGVDANSKPLEKLAGLRPQVAVHVVGEPLSSLPGIFYGRGLGGSAQQILMQYLQTRLRVTPLPSRLVGLTGGMEALTQSLRLGARRTLMARFDALTDSPSVYAAYGARTLTGRLHVVLLLDSRPLIDYNLVLQPTLYYPTESPSNVLNRLLTAAMDRIGNEMSARLHALPQQ